MPGPGPMPHRFPTRVGRTWLFADGTTLPVVAGGDGPAPAPAPTPPAPTPPAPTPPAPTPPAPTPPPEDWKPPASQAELDRIVQDRLARQKAQYADYEDLKGKATKFDELDAANKTELEKATARADAAEKKATDATSRAHALARTSAIVAEASKAGSIDPDAVVHLLAADAVIVGDDGTVTGAAEAVAALLKDKPYLAGKAGGKPTPGFDGGARGNGADGVTVAQLRTMTPQQVAALDPRVVDAALKAG